MENTEKELRKQKLETNQSQQLRHEEPIQIVGSFFLFFAAFFKGRIEIPTDTFLLFPIKEKDDNFCVSLTALEK